MPSPHINFVYIISFHSKYTNLGKCKHEFPASMNFLQLRRRDNNSQCKKNKEYTRSLKAINIKWHICNEPKINSNMPINAFDTRMSLCGHKAHNGVS